MGRKDRSEVTMLKGSPLSGSSSMSQHVMKLNVHYRVHNSPPFARTLSQCFHSTAFQPVSIKIRLYTRIQYHSGSDINRCGGGAGGAVVGLAFGKDSGQSYPCACHEGI